MARRASASNVSDDHLTSCLYAAHKALSYTLVLAVALALVLVLPMYFLVNVNNEAQYTAGLAAFEGLRSNATAGAHTTTAVVSPAFNITVRARNSNTFQAWCHNHGEALVSYSGVALASARVPGFCVPRRSAANFTVVAWGEGLRLSDDLRGRLASERRDGTAKVFLEMKLHHYPK